MRAKYCLKRYEKTLFAFFVNVFLYDLKKKKKRKIRFFSSSFLLLFSSVFVFLFFMIKRNI